MTNNALAGGLIAVLLLLPAGGVAAQNETAKPAGMKVEQGAPAAQPPASAETKPAERKAMKTASAGGKRVEHMFDDARHCLDQPTIADIIKCAEPYRY
jgi:flagellar basal body L-ring protein FlgH